MWLRHIFWELRSHRGRPRDLVSEHHTGYSGHHAENIIGVRIDEDLEILGITVETAKLELELFSLQAAKVGGPARPIILRVECE